MNNIPEPDAVLASEADDRYSSPGKLLKIASWAYFLSWIVLVLNVFLFIGRLYLDLLDSRILDIVFVFNWAYYLSTLMVGIIWFVVLQAISEGINLWLDIEENTRRNSHQ